MRAAGVGAIVLALGLMSTESQATEIGNGNNFGLGIILGYPSGISAKYYLGGRKTAIDGALAFADLGYFNSGFYFHGTYLYHPSVLARDGGFELQWHVGVGGVVWTAYYGWYGDDRWRGNSAVGARFPIGLDFDLGNPRIQFFGDLALSVYLVPGTFIDIDPSLGFRYYF